MERLTKLNKELGWVVGEEDVIQYSLSDKENVHFGTAIDKLADYEVAEKQGLLLRLPCKIGSTLYQPISNRINEYKVIGLCFDITKNKWMYEVAYQIGCEWVKTTCDFDCINKTVFLTKEEAEQALAEMQKGE